MIDPKKLAAMVAKQNEVRPFDNPAMYDDEAMSDEDAMMDEGLDEDEGEDDLGLDEEISEKEIEEIVEMIEDGKGIPELMDLAEELNEAIEEEGEAMANPPAWAANKALWKKAKTAVDPTGKGSKYSEPWAAVAHVYKKMGGTIS